MKTNITPYKYARQKLTTATDAQKHGQVNHVGVRSSGQARDVMHVSKRTGNMCMSTYCSA